MQQIKLRQRKFQHRTPGSFQKFVNPLEILPEQFIDLLCNHDALCPIVCALGDREI
ncbi:hypothetical protein B0H19DRAFT_1167108 [Mycena capillaripes]|nr:hypothetical protein B0H19DRAFT_1167108 [Mycena capillaripes]